MVRPNNGAVCSKVAVIGSTVVLGRACELNGGGCGPNGGGGEPNGGAVGSKVVVVGSTVVTVLFIVFDNTSS
jgi:hypothetical protein